MTSSSYVVKIGLDYFEMISPDEKDKFTCSFRRTVKVPDNGSVFQLPPDLGGFRLFRIEDYQKTLPAHIACQPGMFFGMSKNEATFLNFNSNQPFHVRIYTDGVNVVSGRKSATRGHSHASEDLRIHGETNQNYFIVPTQRFLDGIPSEPGLVKQFVATPSNSLCSIEQQIYGDQSRCTTFRIEVTPMVNMPFASDGDSDRTVFEASSIQIFVITLDNKTITVDCEDDWSIENLILYLYHDEDVPMLEQELKYRNEIITYRQDLHHTLKHFGIGNLDTLVLTARLRGGAPDSRFETTTSTQRADPELKIAAGGLIRQTIEENKSGFSRWQWDMTMAFHVKIVDGKDMMQITGTPPTNVVSLRDCQTMNLPFFSKRERSSDISGDFHGVRSLGEFSQPEFAIHPRVIPLPPNRSRVPQPMAKTPDHPRGTLSSRRDDDRVDPSSNDSSLFTKPL